MTKEEKMKELQVLFDKTQDYFIKMYMDPKSDYKLDEKLEVLKELLQGKKPFEIIHYDDVQDLYPANTTDINFDYKL